MKKLLFIIIFIFGVVLFVGVTASAATSGIYTYTVSNGKATITDCSESASGAVIIPSTLGGYSVTSIGDYAFDACYYLTGITIPDGVTSIGEGAFTYCGLTSITIPDSVTSIGNNAFYYCTGLKSIEIPNGVTNIGNNVFYKCKALTSITIPDGVTSIGKSAFCECTGLTSIIIPDSVINIGNCAFGFCTGLKSITIPDSVTSIGGFTFEYCTGLESIMIPGNVTSIGENIFYECTGLISITIPCSITSIGEFAFHNCTSLADVYYEGSTDEWNYILIGNYNKSLEDATIHYNYSGYNRARIAAPQSAIYNSSTGIAFNINLNAPNYIGVVIGALYTSDGVLQSVNKYPADDIVTISFDASKNGNYIKVLWWESEGTISPGCDIKTVSVN